MTNKFVEGKACDCGLYFIPKCACSLYIPRGNSGIYDSGKKEIEEVVIGWGVIEGPSKKDLLVGYVANKGQICDHKGDVAASISEIEGNKFSLYDKKGNLFASGDFQGYMKCADGKEFYCATLGNIANKAKKVMNIGVELNHQDAASDKL